MSATTCLAKHFGTSSPIAAYRKDMAGDVAELVAEGMDSEAAWLQVAEAKIAELKTERARIEKVVADAYDKAQGVQPVAEQATSAPQVKVYKTRKAAENAKAGNTQRIKKIQGGYILREATDKEMAAADKAGRRLAAGGGVDVERDSLLMAIAKLGGLRMSESADTIGEGNRNVGGKMLFTNSGKSVDDLGNGALAEFGFIPADQRSDPTGWLRDAIKAEFMGSRQFFSDQGTEWMQEDQAASDSLTDDVLDEMSEYDLQSSGYLSATPEVQALTEQLLAEAEALGIDTEAAQEDAARMTEGQNADDYHAALQESIRQAIAEARANAQGRDAGAASASGQDRGEFAGEEGPQDLTLTAPTRAQVLAQQDALEQERAERDAPAEQSRSRLTGDQVDIFNPQGSVFDAIPEPEAAQSAAENVEAETDAIDQRIADAEAAGVVLSESDKDKIRAAITKAEDLTRQANRHSIASADPMRKGNAFPMGVGFTKMTKRAEQRIDASVRRAGEYVKAFNKAEAAAKAADDLLAGKGTDADNERKAKIRDETQRALIGKLLGWKKGDKIGGVTIERVNKDRDGYPATYTISGDGIIAGVMDKVDVAREMFGGDKDKFRAMVDEIKAAMPAEDKSLPGRVKAMKERAANASKTPIVDEHLELFRSVRAGTATPEEFKAMYAKVRDGKEAIVAELNTSTKDELLKGISGNVRPGTTKAELMDLIYTGLLRRFSLGKEYGPQGYFMGQEKAYEKAKRDALDALVEGQTAESLAEYAAEAKAEFDAEIARRAAVMEAVKDPKTLEDFRRYFRLKDSEGMSFQDARMSLTPEQRATMDELSATETRSRRVTAKEDQRTKVSVAGQTVDGEIIATKHTRDGHDLYVVRLAERVSTEDYRTLLDGAKRIGGNYSSYRGNGAVPGFQFRTREAAQAFQKLAQGDNAAAVEAAKERRDAYQDDRSQTAAERLTEMADKMEADADESLNLERKANTARRARFAAAAEAGAREAKAMAKTMRNVAQALTSGRAKFLDRIRTKTQVELLQTYVANAQGDELRAKYPTYAEQEKRKGQPPTQETADYADFPQYTSYRSDLASLGRQLLEVDGTKKLGERLMKVADDVSDAFTTWVKEPGNFYRVGVYSTKDGGRASLPSKDATERAIARSGYRGKAIPWSIKRGEWTVIMSPSEAIAKGIWQGDGDKRITLSDEFGAELVEGIGRVAKRQTRDRLNARAAAVPWQFERAYERRKQLSRMGLERPAEFRSALREFISLREQAAEADRVKMLERSMVGKAKDGLDFFPTPASVADEMVAAAGIEPSMSVLEPSAGMGHIADRIRAAGAEPDVIEMAADRRELLQEKGYYLQPYNDFMQMELRNFFTFGDVMRAPDGAEGIMHGGRGWSGRASLHEVNADGTEGRMLGWYDRNDLVGVRQRGFRGNDAGGYDRILMNPPFSEGRDIQHVRHAFDLLKPGGRLVALMGESAFTNQNKRAAEFREWLESVGGTEEKLAEGTFNDPSLPVNTGANARMVVIEKPEDGAGNVSMYSRTMGIQSKASEAFAAMDDMFALPRTDATDVADIAAAIDPEITVTPHLAEGLDRYEITMPDGKKASIFVREPSPWGKHTYGNTYDDQNQLIATSTDRPGENRDRVPDETGDVWVDVSKLTSGSGGNKVYAIAGALANNTGKILIGDPNGVNDTAMRRRPEQMLSLALRYGTTDFLAPHPQQLMGSVKLGIPPLKWSYGDDAANIRALIDLNLKSLDNAGYGDESIRFDLDAGVYRDSGGQELSRADIDALAASGLGRGANAGGRTLARGAVLRAVLREGGRDGAAAGRRNGLLAAVAKLRNDATQAVEGLFSRGAGTATPEALRQALSAEFGADTVAALESAGLLTIADTPRAGIPSDVAGESDGSSISLYADNTAAGSTAVAYHEAVHAALRQAIGNEAFDALMARVPMLVKANTKWFADAKIPADTPANLRNEELAAYAVQAVQQSRESAPSGVQAWVRDFIAALKAGIAKALQAAGVGMKIRVKLMSDAAVLHRLAGDGLKAMARQGDVQPAMAFSRAPDIRYSRASVTTAQDLVNAKGGVKFSRAGGLASAVQQFKTVDQAKVLNALADLLGSAGAKVSWWDKYLGTQYAKAEKFPAYKRVFQRVQSYIEDVSTLANEAADMAPQILPKLENLRDLKQSFKSYGLKGADAEAVAAPIFEGTLVDQRVYDDSELSGRFKLNAKQIADYRQFLAAVNVSLDQVVAADVLKLLGDKNPALREMALADRAAMRDGIDEYLTEQADAAGEDPAATDDDRGPNTKLRDDIRERYERIEKLKRDGYAPLMRFGKYKVWVSDKETGESLFFGLYESKSEANRMARDLGQDPAFKGAEIEQGVLSEEQYKLFSAVPVESLEMFAEAVGADRSEVFQAYLRLAKNNRSALKRLIHRKGTAGFSEDVGRVLASFVTSNARLASGAMNLSAAKATIEDIRDGDIKDEAIKLVESVQNPQETAAGARALMFANFIGGSIASAVVNLTQPVMMTLPYLSQFGGVSKAAGHLMDAAKMIAAGKITDPVIARAMKRAEDDGIVSPQEIHHLQAQAMGTWGSSALAKQAAFIWGAPFSLAEQFNRRVSFVAAYKTAQERGLEDPFAFAEKAVIESQGLYNKGNMPNLSRNPIGALALQFKQYSIHYLEWIKRMWNAGEPGSPERRSGRHAVLIALALLMMAAGDEGLPFAEDIGDLIDTIGQAIGYDTNTKRAKRNFIAQTLGMGDMAADVFARGLSAMPGVPLDVSIRMSMGNLVPASGIMLRSNTDRSRDLLEVAGPAGGLASQYMGAGQKALAGDFGGALAGATPMAAQNAIKAVGMWSTGEARDMKGNKIMEADQVDGLMKFMGFNPQGIARESQKLNMIRRSEQLAKNVEGEIASAWARAMADGDSEGVKAARQELADWNEANPESRIVITSAQIIQRVRKMRQSREQRFITSTSPERREAIKEVMQ